MRSQTWGFVTENLERLSKDARLTRSFDELQTFLDVVQNSSDLEIVLTDSSISETAKFGVLSDLLKGKVVSETLSILNYLVEFERVEFVIETLSEVIHRFSLASSVANVEGELEPSDSRQISKGRIRGYLISICRSAKEVSELDEIEDELFRFARIVETNSELRSMFADLVIPVENRLNVLDALLKGKVTDSTYRILRYILRAGRMRDYVVTLDECVALIAHERGRRVANVRTVSQLTDLQVNELKEKLTRAQGVPVEIRVVLDPTLVGGMVITVGTTMIDGSVKHKLEELASDLGVLGSVKI